MTNSSPPDPQPNSQKPLGLDEWIGIFVALATMGIIFFWVTGRKGPELKLQRIPDLSRPMELSRTQPVEELPTIEPSFPGITTNDEVDSQSSQSDAVGGISMRGFAGETEGKSRSQQNRGLRDRQNSPSSPNQRALRGAIGISGAGILSRKSGFSSPQVAVDGANGDTDKPPVAGEDSLENPKAVDSPGTPGKSTDGGDAATTGTGESAASPEVAVAPEAVSASGDGSETRTGASGESAASPEKAVAPTAVSGARDDRQTAAAGTAQEPSGKSIEFSDVADEYWAKEFIDRLAVANFISGFPDGSFKPERPITRAEFAANLNGVFGRQPEEKQINYKDVGDNYWAKSAIERATNVGAMNGYPDGDFRPDNPMSRTEVLIAVVTGLNPTVPSNVDEVLEVYQDRDRIPGWAKDKIAAATASGLVVNYPEPELLNPNEPATRADVAALLYQALVFRGKLKPVDSEYVVTIDK